ncbi:MAG: hypothetical protein LQ337_008293 [Flavoplaca oasis]|nr:MAG: hypothetical protein LQ337_008293 [Flavoplaca oasis]
MGRPRKRRRDHQSIQNEGNADSTDDVDHIVDQLDRAVYPAPSSANGFSISTAPSLTNAIQGTSYTATSDEPRGIDPVLAAPSSWHSAHDADLGAYGFDDDPTASNGLSNGALNGLNDGEIPDHYAGILADMRNATDPSIPCTCLTQLHGMLQAFQSMPPASFPSSRDPLTRATKLGRSINRCTRSPLDFSTALQTSMLLITLLRLVVHGYASLLRDIQARAAEGTKITYRVGEVDLANVHLHTGTKDCPLGFTIELDPEEWVAMARKVLKQDIYGNSQNVDCLISVLEELEQLLGMPFNDTDAALRSRHSHPQDLPFHLIEHIRAAVEELQL